MTCLACGGTGDQFDNDTNDWAEPLTKCMYCNGWGEVDDAEQDS